MQRGVEMAEDIRVIHHQIMCECVIFGKFTAESRQAM